MATATEVKERPILFSGPMVRAILDGRKTQTRRVVKGVFQHECTELFTGERKMFDCIKDWDGLPSRLDLAPNDWDMTPYGLPGDRLWVRETWRETFDIDNRPVMEYRAGGTRLVDGKSIKHGEHRTTSVLPPWKSPIFMPRWVSRITLEITGVRVERLQEMGFTDWVKDFCPSYTEQEEALRTFVGKSNQDRLAAQSWDKINGKRGYPWSSNPWVWVIEFKRAK